MVSLLLVVVASVVSVSDVPTPRPHGWITDHAQVVDAAAERRIDAAVDALHRDRGVEIAVVTVDDVPGTPKAFATQLFHHWGIGSAARDNGVLVLLVVARRRLEIETGRGMENALTSAWLADMQQRAMVPRFKAGDIAGGLVAGIDAIAAHVRAAPAEAADPGKPGEYRSDGVPATERPGASSDSRTAVRRNDLSPEPSASSSSGAAVGKDDGAGRVVSFFVGALAIAAVVFLVRRVRRRRACSRCGRPMAQLGGAAADARLDAGQRAEVAVGSMTYIVYGCSACNTSLLVQRRRWRDAHTVCSGCGYCTASVSRTVLRDATYDQEGISEVSETCVQCEHQHRYTAAIPVLERSESTTSLYAASSMSSDYSSSSSSDSSSSSYSDSSSGFSGGSSDGGGAGSSW